MARDGQEQRGEKTVLFIEHTSESGLAKEMNGVLRKLESILGFLSLSLIFIIVKILIQLMMYISYYDLVPGARTGPLEVAPGYHSSWKRKIIWGGDSVHDNTKAKLQQRTAPY